MIRLGFLKVGGDFVFFFVLRFLKFSFGELSGLLIKFVLFFLSMENVGVWVGVGVFGSFKILFEVLWFIFLNLLLLVDMFMILSFCFFLVGDDCDVCIVRFLVDDGVLLIL